MRDASDGRSGLFHRRRHGGRSAFPRARRHRRRRGRRVRQAADAQHPAAALGNAGRVAAARAWPRRAHRCRAGRSGIQRRRHRAAAKRWGPPPIPIQTRLTSDMCSSKRWLSPSLPPFPRGRLNHSLSLRPPLPPTNVSISIPSDTLNPSSHSPIPPPPPPPPLLSPLLLPPPPPFFLLSPLPLPSPLLPSHPLPSPTTPPPSPLSSLPCHLPSPKPPRNLRCPRQSLNCTP